jgi:hypothetical protein
MTRESIAVLFELEGRLDCTLHATEASAQYEFNRLRFKYRDERANHSASVQMVRVQVPEFEPPAIDRPAAGRRMLAGDLVPLEDPQARAVLSVLRSYCSHEWAPNGFYAGGIVSYVCERCGAEDERDRS